MAYKYPITVVPNMGLDHLPPRQAQFLAYLVAGTYAKDTDAAQAAGFSPDNRDAARSRSSQLKRDPRFAAVYQAEVRQKFLYEAAGAAGRLIAVSKNGIPDNVVDGPGHYMAANKEILERTIGPAVPKYKDDDDDKEVEDILKILDDEDTKERQQNSIKSDAHLNSFNNEKEPGRRELVPMSFAPDIDTATDAELVVDSVPAKPRAKSSSEKLRRRMARAADRYADSEPISDAAP